MIVSIVFPTTSAVVFGLLSAWHGHMMLSAGLSSPLRSQGTLLKLAVKLRKHRKTGIRKADALGIYIAFLPIHVNCPNSTWPMGENTALGAVHMGRRKTLHVASIPLIQVLQWFAKLYCSFCRVPNVDKVKTRTALHSNLTISSTYVPSGQDTKHPCIDDGEHLVIIADPSCP